MYVRLKHLPKGTKIFWVQKNQRLLKKAEIIEKLYKEYPICSECSIEYLNHLTVCFYCNKELKFNFKNQEFDSMLESLESSFKDVDIPEIHKLLASYSAVSTYRIVDFRKFFSTEIYNFENLNSLDQRKNKLKV